MATYQGLILDSFDNVDLQYRLPHNYNSNEIIDFWDDMNYQGDRTSHKYNGIIVDTIDENYLYTRLIKQLNVVKLTMNPDIGDRQSKNLNVNVINLGSQYAGNRMKLNAPGVLLVEELITKETVIPATPRVFPLEINWIMKNSK